MTHDGTGFKQRTAVFFHDATGDPGAVLAIVLDVD